MESLPDALVSPLGIGVVALELAVLSRIPLHGGPALQQTLQLALQLDVNWQSLVIAYCLSIITTFVVILITAILISRTNIVVAIRDLDEPSATPTSFVHLIRNLWERPTDEAGRPLPETPLRGLSRIRGAVGALLWGLVIRGPLCLLLGWLMFLLSVALGRIWNNDLGTQLLWMDQLGIALLIAGVGLLVRWVLSVFNRLSPSFAQRLGYSLIGIGWLAYGSQPGGYLLSLFQPPGGNGIQISPRAIEIVLSNLLLVTGAVVLIMANADILIALLHWPVSRLRGLAPVSRTSLSYPLTYRFRTTVSISLLGLVIFLTVLIVTINIGSIQEAAASAISGGFQLESDSPGLPSDLEQQIQANATLRQEIAVVGSAHFLKDAGSAQTMLNIPGHKPQPSIYPPVALNDAFLANTSMPVQARARGYNSDRQVWDAVKNTSGDAVWKYDPAVQGITPTSNGFQPLTATITDNAGHAHRFTVIGIVSANSQWDFLYVSSKSFAQMQLAVQPSPHYFFRVQPGASEVKVLKDLADTFGPKYGMQVQLLSSSEVTATMTNLTIFFSGYLALGLIFGALALGVITSRAVIERRQQIGMLRAIGFSRSLVRRSFLLESGFVISLSLVIGMALALWTAYQVTRSLYPDFPVPVFQVVLILISSYLIAFVATALSAYRASHIRPAEALRYE